MQGGKLKPSLKTPCILDLESCIPNYLQGTLWN